MADQELQYKIQATVTGAESVKNLSGSIQSLNNSAGRFGESSTLLSKAAGLIGVSLAVNKIYDFTSGIIELGDHLYDLSQKTGISVETLGHLKGAAESTDVPIETLAKGLEKFNKATYEAANGSGPILDVFKRFGVSAGELNTKKPEELIYKLADAFKTLPDGAAKTEAAMKLFGKGGAELIPFLNMGSEGVKSFGVEISTEFASKANTFHDNITRVKNNLETLAVGGLGDAVDGFNDLTVAFVQMTKSSSGSGEFFSVLASSLKVAAFSGHALWVTLVEVVDLVVAVQSTMSQAFQTTFATIADSASDLASIVQDILRGDFESLASDAKKLGSNFSRNLALGFQQTKDIGQGFFDSYEEKINDLNKSYDVLFNTQKKVAEQSNVPPGKEILHLQEDIVKEYNKKIAAIRAEADNLGISNYAKEKSVAIAELEGKVTDEKYRKTQEYITIEKSLTQAIKEREIAKERESAEKFKVSQQKEIDLKQLEIDKVNYSTTEYNKLVEAKKLEAAASEASLKYTAEGKRIYLETTQAIIDQKNALEDLQQAQRESYGEGAQQAIRDYSEAAANNAAHMKEAFNVAFKGLEDSIVNFVKAGKLSFKELGASVAETLLRIQIQKAIVFGIEQTTSLFSGGAGGGSTSSINNSSGAGYKMSSGFANGGIMTSDGPMPLSRYADGGIAKSPQVAVFGEGIYNEAFIPLPNGKSVPVEMKGKGESQNSVQVNINMQSGAVDSKSNSDSLRLLGNQIANTVKQILIEQKRPGGILS